MHGEAPRDAAPRALVTIASDDHLPQLAPGARRDERLMSLSRWRVAAGCVTVSREAFAVRSRETPVASTARHTGHGASAVDADGVLWHRKTRTAHRVGGPCQETAVAWWGEGVPSPGELHLIPHLALRTLHLGAHVVKPHTHLVRPRAGYVAAHATDHRDATQPALIGRRTAWVHLRADASRRRLTKRGLDQGRVLLVELGPLDCREELGHDLPP